MPAPITTTLLVFAAILVSVSDIAGVALAGVAAAFEVSLALLSAGLKAGLREVE